MSGPRVADRLSDARRRLFVGRAAELELFARTLAQEPGRRPAVLFVHGPGGVGKTALLHEYARLAAERGLPVLRLDGRTLEPGPDRFVAAVRQLAPVRPGPDAAAAADWTDLPPCVLLLDTFERLAPLERWLRDAFLPLLPAHVLVVIAGRDRPTPEWRADLAWRGLLHVLPLGNLEPGEGRLLLESLGVPADRHEGVLAFTRGHPLALALIGDVVAQRSGGEPFAPEQATDAVRALLERFLREVQGPDQRRALEVCAHARVTTESLLAEVLGADAAPALFAWLASLSFIEHAPDGIFPHDLVRDALDLDLRWRAPETYREVHRGVRRHVVRRVQASTGLEQQRASLDLVYLHRNNPLMRPYFEWEALGSGYAEPAAVRDHGAILEMVRAHEDAASARVAAHWLERQPGGFLVFRDVRGEAIGFAMTLALHAADARDAAADPAVEPALRYMERYGPLRPGEQALFGRYWMGRERYQSDAVVFGLLAALSTARWLATPDLAWTLVALAEPERWRPMWMNLNFHRATEADFAVGDRRFGVYAHDWRAEPATVWLDRMAERELAAAPMHDGTDPTAAPAFVVLARDEFTAAVRQALRDYTRPRALAANPLLRTRLVAARAEAMGSGAADPGVAALRALLREAVDALKGNPRDEKLQRALHHTYLHPARTQEAAAALLRLPFNTYRYHLARGLERVTGALWEQELGVARAGGGRTPPGPAGEPA